MMDIKRAEKKKLKLEKALRKMSKKDRIKLPLVEVEVDPKLIKERKERTRKVDTTEDEVDKRQLLLKVTGYDVSD